jgi:hypothetical protein
MRRAIDHTTFREWTVDELRQFIAGLPSDAKIKLYDADTCWTIPKFELAYDDDNNELWFYPCDYSEMNH